MTRVGYVRWPGLVRALAVAVLVIVVGVVTTGSATASPAVSHYDTAAYIYDAPALLSSPDTVATDARGSPSRSGATPWGRSLSAGGFVANTNSVPSGALRPVGQFPEAADDVMANPQLLRGMTPAQVESAIGHTPGWQTGVTTRGRNIGDGWTFRQMNAAGTDFTDRYIQWSPGTPRHFGGTPYWKVSSGDLGTVRFSQ